MRAGFRHRILGHFARMIDVGHVNHVHDATDGNALATNDVKNRWEHFVADKNIILVTKD